jgi:hypothetical protein
MKSRERSSIENKWMTLSTNQAQFRDRGKIKMKWKEEGEMPHYDESNLKGRTQVWTKLNWKSTEEKVVKVMEG